MNKKQIKTIGIFGFMLAIIGGISIIGACITNSQLHYNSLIKAGAGGPCSKMVDGGNNCSSKEIDTTTSCTPESGVIYSCPGTTGQIVGGDGYIAYTGVQRTNINCASGTVYQCVNRRWNSTGNYYTNMCSSYSYDNNSGSSNCSPTPTPTPSPGN